MNEAPAPRIPSNFQTARPAVCAVVLNYNDAPLTLNCVQSVLESDYPNFRVLVVDNGSTDGSAAVFQEALKDPRIEILGVSPNQGLAAGTNRGIEHALAGGFDYLLLMNNDTLLFPSTLSSLVAAIRQSAAIGLVTGRSFASPARDRTTVCAYTRLPTALRTAASRFLTAAGFSEAAGRCLGEYRDFPGSSEVAWAGSAVVLVRRETIECVGLWDEQFHPYYGDTDWCLRMRKARWRIRYCGDAEYVHFVGATLTKRGRVRQNSRRNYRRFLYKHYGILACVLYSAVDFALLNPLETMRHWLRPLRNLRQRTA